MIAIDIFVSSLTESQIISAVAGLAIGLIIFFMDNIINYIPFDWLKEIFESVNKSFSLDYSDKVWWK